MKIRERLLETMVEHASDCYTDGLPVPKAFLAEGAIELVEDWWEIDVLREDRVWAHKVAELITRYHNKRVANLPS